MNIHQPSKDRKRFKCKACDKTFSTHASRYKHVKAKHLGIKEHCEECDKYVLDVKLHQLTMHNSAALPYACVPCGRRFISPSALEKHKSLHTKDRPHECDVCQKTFRLKVLLVQHKRAVHNKEKTHLCQFCSKSFFKKYHLQIHVRSHTKEKPHECPDCGKTFSSSTNMKDHRLIHSEVKMFPCSLCDSSFAKPGYLKSHMLRHTEERQFPCKYCEARFRRADYRKQHEYTAHEKHLVAALCPTPPSGVKIKAKRKKST